MAERFSGHKSKLRNQLFIPTFVPDRPDANKPSKDCKCVAYSWHVAGAPVPMLA